YASSCCSLSFHLCLMHCRTPRSRLFPYTTLFRSVDVGPRHAAVGDVADDRNRLSFQRSPALAQAERIEQPLGGMLVGPVAGVDRSEEHTSELQSLRHLVCCLLLEKKKCVCVDGQY